MIGKKVRTTERLGYLDLNGELQFLEAGSECIVEALDDDEDTYILLHWPYGEDGGIVHEIPWVRPRQWEETP